MFARDEMDEICQELVPIMKKQYPRRPPTNENLYDYFLSRVRQNLHVVLCFSPVGEKFRKRGSCRSRSSCRSDLRSLQVYNSPVSSPTVRSIGFFVGRAMRWSPSPITFSPRSTSFVPMRSKKNSSNAWAPFTTVSLSTVPNTSKSIVDRRTSRRNRTCRLSTVTKRFTRKN